MKLTAKIERSIKNVFLKVEKSGGFGGACRKVVTRYRLEGVTGLKNLLKGAIRTELQDHSLRDGMMFLKPVESDASKLLATSVLIIAELSISQCTKYRVEQKKRMFEFLGVPCLVVSWTDAIACLDALSTSTLAIFYRVPGYQMTLDLIDEAKRLGVQTVWEVDDLIFDAEVLLHSRALAVLDKDTFQNLIEGANLYRKAMLACEKGLASTKGLALEMNKAGLADVFVVENALDDETLSTALKISVSRKDPSGIVRIVYGSGTNTHDVDFLEVSNAMQEILRQNSNVRFRLIGMVDLPESFEEFSSQIERIAFCTYAEYLKYLGECDISIAPLENYIFNDAKSNIKFLEASVVRLPSVCSPRSAFSEVITHGENGFLCDRQEEWEAALSLLIKSPDLRERVAQAAYWSVNDAYLPESIAVHQLAPILAGKPAEKAEKRILSVNILYSPRSFGGATIVAEQINKLINARQEFEVFVFTSLPPGVSAAGTVRRYEVDGVSVFAAALPDDNDPGLQFDNKLVDVPFSRVVAAVNPDIVHFHCLQGIGVSLADYCIENEIPYYITLHDAWWLCGRQFMINREGNYCGQEVIDLEVCAKCVENPVLNASRQERLRIVLEKATLLFSPSKYFADFYLDNGLASAKVMVNKNGVMRPAKKERLKRTRPVTFGYVGGNTRIKGVHLITKVFAGLGSDVKLLVVDNAINLGYSSFDDSVFEACANVEIVPAYTQKDIDEFFESIDVLLFPTQWKESFGLTVREALSRNVWVIVTDAGGVTEDITHGGNGYIVPFNDDGSILKEAVVDAIHYFDQIDVGSVVELDNPAITWFEDQADELAGVFLAMK